MPPVKPKKALGQHFLTDLSIARRIAATISAGTLPDSCAGFASLPVLEIGPGTGVLTQYLISPGRELTLVEIDPEAAAYIRRTYPDTPLIEDDFLRLPDEVLYPGREFCIIGNYPYNISSQIFFRLLELRGRVPMCAGMLQREVAQRLCAGPGSKTYGILSVLLQVWYDCEYLFTVDEHVFHPAPKVKSGVIRLLRNGRKELPCSEQDLRKVVKTAFGQRRKTLRNSLAPMLDKTSALYSDPVLALRPEQLSVDDFITLTLRIYTNSR